MASIMLRIQIIFLVIYGVASALQVTPNSPCSSSCSHTTSNAIGLEIPCSDSAYSAGKVQDFKQCVECLQTSSFGSEDENDQQWFIHNLRLAGDWCLFDPKNLDKPTGPCMVEMTCGGLEVSLDARSSQAQNGSAFDYCTVDKGSFDENAATCNACLQHMSRNKYLANWIVALEAGCSQRPSQKALIGLSGSVFTLDSVVISAPVSPEEAAATKDKGETGLQLQAKIGIIVGVVVTFLIVAGVFTVQCYKRRQRQKLNSLRTKCHSRFGAVDIPAPLTGTYSEYKPEPAIEILPWDEDYMLKEVRTDSRTSTHTKLSSVSSSETNEPPKAKHEQICNDSGLGGSIPCNSAQERRLSHHEDMSRAPVSASTRQFSDASGEPERLSTHMNPLRMNSYVKSVTSSRMQSEAAARPSPAPAQQTSTSPPAAALESPRSFAVTASASSQASAIPLQSQVRSHTQTRSRTLPPPLNLHATTAYNPPSRLQPMDSPDYASSIINSTSTKFSLGVYQSPPAYISPIQRPKKQQPSQHQHQSFPVAPLPAYNPASYAPKPTNPYPSCPVFQLPLQQPQPQQRQFNTPSFHRPQLFVASIASFPYSASQSKASPPNIPSAPPQNRHALPKAKASEVPIIALPVPAPKRQTIDMRSFVGIGVSSKIRSELGTVPSMSSLSKGRREERKMASVELPEGLDRTESILRRCDPQFQNMVRRLSPDLPKETGPSDAAKLPSQQQQQPASPDLRASYRGRSLSRPRREEVPDASKERGGRNTSGSRFRDRLRSRSSDLGESKRAEKGFSFGFRGQDVIDTSPLSGDKTDVDTG